MPWWVDGPKRAARLSSRMLTRQRITSLLVFLVLPSFFRVLVLLVAMSITTATMMAVRISLSVKCLGLEVCAHTVILGRALLEVGF